MTRVQELVEQVRALSEDERDEFLLLLAENDDDFELSEEWKEEIRRRIDDLDAGRVKPIPWETVRDELRERTRAASG